MALQADAEWSKRALYERLGIKKCTFTVFVPLLLPPPPQTHQRDSYVPVYLLSLLPSQFNIPSFVHSNGCPFKKLFPSLKISYVPCSLIWSLFLSKSSIYFVLSYLKMSLFPKNALGRNMSKGNKCYCSINNFKGGKLIKNMKIINSGRNMISFSTQLNWKDHWHLLWVNAYGFQ